MRRTREYQQRTILSNIARMIEDFDKFETNLSDFTVTYKRLIPTDVATTRTLQQFENHVNAAADDVNTCRLNLQVMTSYLKMVQSYREMLVGMEEHVWFPLSQVHAWNETESQRKMKRLIVDRIAETKMLLRKSTDLNSLKHPTWKFKILMREEGLFMGLVCLIPIAIEAIKNCDHDLDEYLSGAVNQSGTITLSAR